ncbi:MAG: PD40 domain-containing protein [Dehalococcoidia bacterium]|nr:PD40 domain-containing protein [Dehalococcoidia bacterium]
MRAIILVCLAVAAVLSAGCLEAESEKEPLKLATRAEAIPADAVKVTPETDVYRPVVHLDGWEQPVPVEGPVNTAGGEDAPFVLPDGSALYFVFVSDVNLPAQEQLLDGATGIWRSVRTEEGWAEPERIVLNDDLSLDGCPFVENGVIWFCSARAGSFRGVDVYTAQDLGGRWGDWKNAGEQLNNEYGIGEIHLSADGNTLYFDWDNEAGMGGKDIWMSERAGENWGPPVNLGPGVNSSSYEIRPFVSTDGNELWFTSQSRLGYAGPAVFRSLRQADGTWGEAEEIISNFAAEPALDDAGNIYFAHHFFPRSGSMIEADIYVAYRR